MRLQRYLDRLHTILTSRQELVLEYLHIDEIVPGQVGMIEGRLRFWDNSLLEFTEAIAMHTMILAKTGTRIITKMTKNSSSFATITHRIIQR